MISTISTVLTEAESQLWRDERRALDQLLAILSGWDTSPEDVAVLRQAVAQLDELFLLVVAGEFNSGKSALINALLGERYLTEGVTPTTAEINIIRYGEKGPPRLERGLRVITYPAPFLREINMVDTPGTNAVLREHEEITREFVPRSDLVLFVTSADRPFTESERAFLSAIRDWGKKIVIVVNKIDILETEGEQAQVLGFVRDNARQLLGRLPEIFPVSARMALRAKLARQETLALPAPAGDGAPVVPHLPQVDTHRADAWWELSQFQPFEQYIHETLNEKSRVRLKLLNPLGVGLRIAEQYRARMDERQSLLRDDLQTVDSIERQLALYRQDMQAEFERRFDRIDNAILQMRIRGEEFFDEQLRLRRIMDLLNARRLAEDFETLVVADTPETVETQVHEMVDWMVERELKEWRAISRELNRRQKTEMLGHAAEQTAGGFEYNRRELLESVGRSATAEVARFDSQVESQRLVEGVQDALAQTALAEVGAVSLGVILHVLLAGAAADATGLLAAGVVGALGFAILPYKKSQAKADLREKTDDLRERLRTTLSESFAKQLERSVERLGEALGPYSRFIRGENERLVELQEEMTTALNDLNTVRDRVDQLLPEASPA